MMKQEFGNILPFRWNLKEKRALKAMLEHAVAKKIPDTRVPRDFNQKGYARAQKAVESRRGQVKYLVNRIDYAKRMDSKFQTQMLKCSARIVAQGADYDLIFVGRSPESIFDFLSGLCLNSIFAEQLNLLQLSLRMYPKGIKNRSYHKELKRYFFASQLDPRSILNRKRPVAFVDLVYSGATFYSFTLFLKDWTEELGLDWILIRKKIRFIGILERRKTSPNTVRWQQQLRWKNLIQASSAKNVSIDWSFWDYLGNSQYKSTESFTEDLWGKEEALSPKRNISTLTGLESALFWFESGCTKDKRLEFSELLAQQPEMKSEAVRKIVSNLRK